MKQKKFGTGGPDVSVIGQGTWYLDRGDRKAAVAALRRGIETRPDPHRYRRDVWRCGARDRGRHRGPARQALPGLESIAEQCLAARHHHRLRAVVEAAQDRSSRLLSAALARLLSASRRRSRRSTNWSLREKSVPGASAISMRMISANCLRLRARAKSPATRCSIICRNVRSNTPSFRGASSTALPSSPIRRSATMIFRLRAARPARCCRR